MHEPLQGELCSVHHFYIAPRPEIPREHHSTWVVPVVALWHHLAAVFQTCYVSLSLSRQRSCCCSVSHASSLHASVVKRLLFVACSTLSFLETTSALHFRPFNQSNHALALSDPRLPLPKHCRDQISIAIRPRLPRPLPCFPNYAQTAGTGATSQQSLLKSVHVSAHLRWCDLISLSISISSLPLLLSSPLSLA